MPQIWMTYDEIAGLVRCPVEHARAQVDSRALDRKKSRDGLTRVKLDTLWTALFVARIRETDPEIDRAVADLRRTHAEMAAPQRKTRVA